MDIPHAADRAIIVVLNETEYVRCSYAPETVDLLSAPSIWLIQTPPDPSISEDPMISRLARNRMLVHGNVLFQVPYELDAYELDDVAQERMAQRKHLIFAELCRLLGATHVRLNVLVSEGSDGEVRIEGGASGEMFKAEASSEWKRAWKMFSELTLEDEYDGMSSDIAAADALLERTGLVDDPHLASFVNARRSGNPLRSRRYTVDLSRETTSMMRLAAQLDVLSVVNVSLSGLKSESSKQTYRATYDVSFK